MSWACGACTYINVAARTTCEICGTAAPRRAPPVQTVPSVSDGVQVTCGGCTARLLIPSSALSFICPHCRTTTQRATSTARLPSVPQPSMVRPSTQSLPSARPLPFQPPRPTFAPASQHRPSPVPTQMGGVTQQAPSFQPPSYSQAQVRSAVPVASRASPPALPTAQPSSRPKPTTRTNSAASQAVTGQSADEFDFSFTQFQENTFSQYQRLRSNLAAAHDRKMPVSELQIKEFKEYQVSVAQQLAKFQTVLNSEMIKLPKNKDYKKTLFKCQTAFAKAHLDNAFLSKIQTYPETQDTRPKITSKVSAEKKIAARASPSSTQAGAGRGNALPSRQPFPVSGGRGTSSSASGGKQTGYTPPVSLVSFESSLQQRQTAQPQQQQQQQPQQQSLSSSPSFSSNNNSVAVRAPMSLSAFENSFPVTTSSTFSSTAAAAPSSSLVHAPMSLSLFEQNLSSSSSLPTQLQQQQQQPSFLPSTSTTSAVSDVTTALAGFDFTNMTNEQQQQHEQQQLLQLQQEQQQQEAELQLQLQQQHQQLQQLQEQHQQQQQRQQDLSRQFDQSVDGGVVLHVGNEQEQEQGGVGEADGEVREENGDEHGNILEGEIDGENVELEEEEGDLLVLEPCSLQPNQFQGIWTDAGCYNVTLTLKLDLAGLRDFAEFEKAFTEPPLSAQLLASGMVNGRIKIYAYGKNAQSQAYFLIEILVEASTGVATITLKSEPQNSAECNSAFIGLIGHSLRPFNPEPV